MTVKDALIMGQGNFYLTLVLPSLIIVVATIFVVADGPTILVQKNQVFNLAIDCEARLVVEHKWLEA